MQNISKYKIFAFELNSHYSFTTIKYPTIYSSNSTHFFILSVLCMKGTRPEGSFNNWWNKVIPAYNLHTKQQRYSCHCYVAYWRAAESTSCCCCWRGVGSSESWKIHNILSFVWPVNTKQYKHSISVSFLLKKYYITHFQKG